MAKLLFEPIILFAALCSIGFFFGVRAPVAQASTLAAAATAQQPAESPAEDHPSKRRFHGSFARLERLLRRYGYWAAGGATLAEGIGIPLPGQTLLIAGGVEAAEGRMSIAVLLLIVATTATLGNSLGYLIGYWGGRFVLSKLKVDPERQRHLQELFKRRGGLVILFARFIDGLRQLNGIVSGTMKMPWWTFTAYNVAGALLWTCAWGFGSYYFGRRIRFIAGFFHRHQPLLFSLGAATLLLLIIYFFRARNEKKNGTTGNA